MSTVVNSFPITVTPPSGFTETAALEGKFLTVAGDQKIAWSSVITLLEQIFDGSETVITGSNVTGNGTQADPYVISNEAGGVGSGNASVVVADNLGQLPAVGLVSTVYFVFDKDGEGTNGVFAYRPSVTGYEDMTPGGSSTGGGTSQYNVSSLGVLFSGDAGSGGVTAVVNSPGVMTVTVPSGVNNFSITVPSSVIGTSPDNDVTVHFDFPGGGVFNQSELTMRYPRVGIFSRATESSGGFDVEMLGNNPQRRLLPFAPTTVGRCSSRVAGISAAGSPFTLTFTFG